MRQVLDQELQKTIVLRENAARQARFQAGRKVGAPAGGSDEYIFDDKENVPMSIAAKKMTEREKARLLKIAGGNVKKDFFGRVIVEKVLTADERLALGETDGNKGGRNGESEGGHGGTVWVTYNEGLNEAVKKPITLEEFMRGF